MTANDAFREVLERIAATRGRAALISTAELDRWPKEAMTALKSQRLIRRTRPASSVICPGCERACTMPVHTLATPGSPPASFIVCDKRDDINRVAIDPTQTSQWRSDLDAIREFVAASLGVSIGVRRPADNLQVDIGIAAGARRRQMLALRFDGSMHLVVGAASQPLLELVEFHENQYLLDQNAVRQLIDASTTADPRYTPTQAKREARKLATQAMYASWRKAYRTSKRDNPDKSDVWHSQRLARQEIGHKRDADTIRKHMKG